MTLKWALVPGQQGGRLGRSAGIAAGGGNQDRDGKDVQNDKADGDRCKPRTLARRPKLKFAVGRFFTERHGHVLRSTEGQTGATWRRSGGETAEGCARPAGVANGAALEGSARANPFA